MMEPLPEVHAAAEQLAALTGVDPVEAVVSLAELAVAVVPSCVGVSLTVVVGGEPYTLSATTPAVALLDAVQYLDGGPCVDAAHDGRQVVVGDVLDERRWQLYGHAARAAGVRASLTLPLGGGGSRAGAVDLYASDPDAFTGRQDLLAAVFGVPADQLVANADLTFMTRDFARRLPDQLREQSTVDQAVGVLAALRGWPPDQARSRLRSAAGRAGASLPQAAELVLTLNTG